VQRWVPGGWTPIGQGALWGPSYSSGTPTAQWRRYGDEVEFKGRATVVGGNIPAAQGSLVLTLPPEMLTPSGPVYNFSALAEDNLPVAFSVGACQHPDVVLGPA
jgi:hypothetical protein